MAGGTELKSLLDGNVVTFYDHQTITLPLDDYYKGFNLILMGNAVFVHENTKRYAHSSHSEDGENRIKLERGWKVTFFQFTQAKLEVIK